MSKEKTVNEKAVEGIQREDLITTIVTKIVLGAEKFECETSDILADVSNELLRQTKKRMIENLNELNECNNLLSTLEKNK